MSDIVFEVTEAVEGGYDARAVGHSIFTQGSDWADLKEMVSDAVRCHFDEGDSPDQITLLVSTNEAHACCPPYVDIAPTTVTNCK
jgi:hypothetical protein